MIRLLRKADLPPVWLALHVVLAAVLNETKPLWIFGSNPVAGGVLLVAGLALIGWSAVHFLRKRTPIEPRRAPESLITGGPFVFNRNPIYTGMELMLLGVGLLLGSLGALLPCLLFPVVITRRFIRGEEALLRERFGDEAEAWIARTRRW
jgi:protein-S-isoprenylcysteine O-methyltransferase Ste14